MRECLRNFRKDLFRNRSGIGANKIIADIKKAQRILAAGWSSHPTSTCSNLPRLARNGTVLFEVANRGTKAFWDFSTGIRQQRRP
jgi:hypothetical protein